MPRRIKTRKGGKFQFFESRKSRMKRMVAHIKKQRGGFIFSLAAIGSAIAAAVSAAAPAVATGAATAAAAYGTKKLLTQVGGRRPRRIRRRLH